jgi:hypothetical protein
MDRLFLRNAYGLRADALRRLQRHAEAVKDLDRAIELDEGPMRPELRVSRAVSLAVMGDHAKAAAEAEAVAALRAISADRLAGCARALCFCADASKDDVPQSNHYADRAMAILKRAVAAGSADVVYLKTHADWAAIRSRDDFKQLVSDVEKRSPAKREK